MFAVTNDLHRPLLGRQGEVALITSLLERIQTSGAAVLLRGGPGIGKSRLLTAAAEIADAHQVSTLSATGVQSEARLPFSGLHQLLRPIRDRTQELAPALRASLDNALGVGDGTAPEPFRIAMAVLDLFSEVAAETPLLVVVDDVQWLDRASTDVLAFIARRLDADPIVLLAAIREGYPSVLSEAGLPELSLSGLNPTVAAELLDASGRELMPAVRDRVLREADGNPLGLIELPRAADRIGSGPGLPPALPLTERLEHAFAARMRDLPDDTRMLLLTAALIDGDDIAQVLRAAGTVAGRSIGAERLEPAANAAVIEVDVQTIRFRHPLMRSAMRQSASVAQQRQVHEALASAPDGDPDRRAWHRAALITGVNEEVARGLEEAGHRARLRGSTGDALTALARAADLSDQTHRARRLLDTAQLAVEVGQPEAVAALLREVERLEPGPLDKARATWIEQLASVVPLDSAGAAALISAAQRAEEEDDRELHIELLWLLALRTWWAGNASSVRDVLTQASQRLGGADAADARVVAIYAYADAVGHTPQVLRRLRAVLAQGSCGTDAARYFGEAAQVIGAFELAAAFLHEASDGLRSEGRLGHLARTLCGYSFDATFCADWDVAVPAAEEAARLSTEFKQPIGIARAETVQSMIAGMRGDLATAERLSTKAEQVGLSLGFRPPVIFAQFGKVAGELGAGRNSDAYASAARLFEASDSAHHPVIASWFIADLAEAAAHTGKVEEAAARVEQVAAAVGETPTIFLALSLRHARAVLADSEQEAERRFEEALGADLSRWPFSRARLLLAHGRWLRRQRRITESRVPLRAARDTFDALGCVSWGERAREELRASGESSRRRDPAARDRLTAQELQIARLAAEGLSNRAIGERLYLSPRTISTHLYRIFPKLGISTRGEIAASLAPATSQA